MTALFPGAFCSWVFFKCFLKPALQFQHLRIDSTFLHEFGMISLFSDTTAFENENHIRFFHCLETMGDNENRASCKEVMECLTDFLFRKTIESTCRFVEEDNVGIFEEYLRDSETLFLSTGEFHSPFPNLRFESLRQIEYEVCMSLFECIHDVRFLSIGSFSLHEVLTDRPVENLRILGQVPDVRVKRREIHGREIKSIDRNFPTFRREKPGCELHNRRLPPS